MNDEIQANTEKVFCPEFVDVLNCNLNSLLFFLNTKHKII